MRRREWDFQLGLDSDDAEFLQRLLEDPFEYAESRERPLEQHTPQMLADEERRETVLNRLENVIHKGGQ